MASGEQIKALAQQMGVTETDVRGFVDCLALWMRKGYSMEQAIEKHMAQMLRLINRDSDAFSHASIRSATADVVWDAVNKSAAA